MNLKLLAISLGLGPIGWGVVVFSAISFLIMFGISSVKGDYKGIIEDALRKPLGK